MLAAKLDHLAVDIDHRRRFDRAMHQHFPQRRPFAAADNQHVSRIGMPQHGRLHEQFMINGLVVLGALNRPVEHQGPAVIERVGDQHILKCCSALEDHFRKSIGE